MDHGMDAQSLSNVFAPSPVVAGGMLVHNGTQYVNLPLGTVGQYPRSNGSTVIWSAPVIGDISLASGNIIVGNVSGVATSVAMSGNVTISNTGVTTIGIAQVTNAMLVNNTITLGTTTMSLGNTYGTIAGAITFSGVITMSSTTAFTNSSPFSISNGQTLTISTTSQTIGAATLTVPNFAGVSDTFAFIVLAQTIKNKTLDTSNVLADANDTTKQIGFSISGNTTGIKLIVASIQSTAQTLTLPNITGADTVAVTTLAQTLSNKTLASPTISGTITMSTTPTVSGNFALNSQTISGTATFSGANTFSATQSFTNSSPFSVANGQTLTVSVTAQTVGAATLTIPNFASVSDTFAFITLAQTLSNKTLASPTISGTISGTYNIGGIPTLTVTLNANAQTISGGFTSSGVITSTGGITMSGSDITLAGNKIKTNSISMYESSIDNLIVQPNNGPNANIIFNIAPLGGGTLSVVQLYRSGFGGANQQLLLIGSDAVVANEYTIISATVGTINTIPINVYMQANNGGTKTKLLSFDVANTVTSYVNFIINSTATFTQGGGLQMGTPTGGDKGLGTINVATNIFLNNTAYTNPDYVFEKYYTGTIIKYKDNFGAKDYNGLLPLYELEQFVKENLHLPIIHRNTAGIVERFDWLLAYTEELHLRIFDLNRRIKQLEVKQ